MTSSDVIRFQASPADRDRIKRIQDATEVRTMSEVIRAALRAYEIGLSQKLAKTMP